MANFGQEEETHVANANGFPSGGTRSLDSLDVPTEDPVTFTSGQTVYQASYRSPVGPASQ